LVDQPVEIPEDANLSTAVAEVLLDHERRLQEHVEDVFLVVCVRPVPMYGELAEGDPGCIPRVLLRVGIGVLQQGLGPFGGVELIGAGWVERRVRREERVDGRVGVGGGTDQLETVASDKLIDAASGSVGGRIIVFVRGATMTYR
jgi:hypothetical protein